MLQVRIAAGGFLERVGPAMGRAWRDGGGRYRYSRRRADAGLPEWPGKGRETGINSRQ